MNEILATRFLTLDEVALPREELERLLAESPLPNASQKFFAVTAPAGDYWEDVKKLKQVMIQPVPEPEHGKRAERQKGSTFCRSIKVRFKQRKR